MIKTFRDLLFNRNKFQITPTSGLFNNKPTISKKWEKVDTRINRKLRRTAEKIRREDNKLGEKQRMD